MSDQRQYYPVILASPITRPVRHKDELEHEYEKDINLFALNNKYRLKDEKRKPFYCDYPKYKRYCEIRDKVK
jgi:hypothetical protein